MNAHSENSSRLPPYLAELLHRNRVEVITELPCGDVDMAAFLIIAPIRERRPTDWETRLAPTASYELRYLRHQRKFTEADWGNDYDLVLKDAQTRLKRERIPRSPDDGLLAQALVRYGATPGSFIRVAHSSFDSALVCNFHDWFFDFPGPHLMLEDWA